MENITLPIIQQQMCAIRFVGYVSKNDKFPNHYDLNCEAFLNLCKSIVFDPVSHNRGYDTHTHTHAHIYRYEMFHRFGQPIQL